ncbi:Viral A-type inclusion protein repeat-containing domain protein [Trichostrongylus colubriformis]|uniref:Viral A-type inclusion protein repeat-containing domain protein n=1 Tax=Trichostrongylus colubriformis TaxID=6319 RepID=A0AAN8IDZ8_TRICO
MVHPQGDLEQPVLNPLNYNITQSRFGLGEYGSAFNVVQPRCSSYEPHDMGSATAPAPAPAPRGTSVGPSRHGYPSTSTRRQTLTRQHRSMDTMGALEAAGADLGAHDAPLAISTNFPLHHQSSGLQSVYRAPLSNPTSTNQNFWSNVGGMSHYSEAGGDRLQGGLSLSAEYEQLKADYQASIEKLNQTMNSIKTFWSPELKRERQMRREVERLLQTSAPGTVAVSQDVAHLRMEIVARDEKIRQLSTMLDESMAGQSGLSDMRIRELEETVAQLQEMLKINEQQMMGGVDSGGRFALENALRIAEEKQARINELQEEVSRLRIGRAGQPRDFTDKSITSHEMVTLRMKMERSEVELSERKAELAQCQARMRHAEEQAADLRQHVQLLKEQITNREQQHTLLQGDVDALRQKLEGKNQQMEQRDQRIERLEKELANAKGEVSEKNEQIQQAEHRTSQMMGRIDGLETSLRDKEAELDKAKIRLLSHPDVIKEKEMKDKIESMTLEKKRLQDHIDQLRRNSEKERLEQQETYQTELRQLRCNVENLQKELADRDVLLESQNEKIGDMDRELAACKQRLQAAITDKGVEELHREVESARGEVEKLLKMVRQLEKENTQLSSQCKQLQGAIDRGGTEGSSGTLTKGEITSMMPGTILPGGISAQAKKRIEELEEALRESVSITAEREVHLSQQKHILHQVNQQLNDARRENAELRKRVAEGSTSDREQLMRALEAERRQHIEQLLQLKQEALLAAISEKDAHLALLEKSRAPREEIDNVRRHKEALMRKLKQENERRAMVVRPDSAASVVQPGAATVAVGGPTPFITQPSPRQGDVMNMSGELDDAEGIWA